MEELNFANNRLYGPVPDELCTLPKITNLSLSGNYFTSLGESCWTLLKKKVLHVGKNCIPWLPDQRPKEECEHFFAIPRTYCPLDKHIPCKLPLDQHETDDHSLSSPAGGGRSRRLLGSGSIYGTLHAH
ncbi:putative leucine-rich repeat domain superfamily [Dioscorea sansibarensis]